MSWRDELVELLGRLGFEATAHELWIDRSSETGVAIHPSGAFVGWLDTAWPGPGSPALVLEQATHLPTSECGGLDSALRSALAAAGNARRAALRSCRYCGLELTPGHMHDDVCHGCAEKHLGVVH